MPRQDLEHVGPAFTTHENTVDGKYDGVWSARKVRTLAYIPAPWTIDNGYGNNINGIWCN